MCIRDSVTTMLIGGWIAAASNPQNMWEYHGEWQIRWTRIDDQLQIQELSVEHEESLLAEVGGGHWFRDCTSSILSNNDCYQSQLLVGLHHWLQQSQDTRAEALLGTPGIAIGDVNGDGLDDVYLCQESGLPNRLFFQQPNGTLLDRSKDAGVDWIESSRGCLLLDLDNDGDRDLAVAMLGLSLIHI